MAAQRIRQRQCGGGPAGFTLVELLVVIAIIGILVAMLVPAVQMAREAARRTECGNNLKQFGVAANQHLSVHNFFPTGGWGRRWIGDPTRGFDAGQPGGWLYNLLPYLDKAVLHDRGDASMTQTPIPEALCPTRRRVALYPFDSTGANFVNLSMSSLTQCNKTDYAANVGTGTGVESPGPSSLSQGSQMTAQSGGNGVIFQCSQVTAEAMQKDGLSNTILIGEKSMDPSFYSTGRADGDRHTALLGFCSDNCRSAADKPKRDESGANYSTYFGSAHAAGCIFVFCDGSTHLLHFSVDQATFGYLGSRNDGQTVDPSKL
jgi:prepilin-type N-terminal cleavage/methylation domain-containing protein